ncbi:MAG: hypothetical protein Ct9H300mP16_05340 [Pseudomonadota bacterium]|nr:MAG: hypothetical protein Ct9H300mP16_05340 [Pseudomonadota bacterium]
MTVDCRVFTSFVRTLGASDGFTTTGTRLPSGRCSPPGGDGVGSTLEAYDWLYLTGVTLSVLQAGNQIDTLIEVLAKARAQGGRVAFDTNYRPAGWDSTESARAVFRNILDHVDVGPGHPGG